MSAHEYSDSAFSSNYISNEWLLFGWCRTLNALMGVEQKGSRNEETGVRILLEVECGRSIISEVIWNAKATLNG